LCPAPGGVKRLADHDRAPALMLPCAVGNRSRNGCPEEAWMRGTIDRHKGLLTLALPALLLGATGLPASGNTTTALDIVSAGNGTKLGSIAFPTPTGSAAQGVAFELNAGSQVFTQGDITAVSWALNPVLSLSLQAGQGDNPCSSPSHGPCSRTTLTLTAEHFSTATITCPQQQPGVVFPCFSFLTFITEVAFVATAPAYACVGFEPPLADGPVTVRGNRALPLKAELLDEDGFALTDADLGAAPVVQIDYQSGIGAQPEDVSDQALWAGQGSSGNRFVFSGDRWRFNLKVGNYSAPGTYVISMISGDGAEYAVDPTCEAQFIVNP
ncbi:MAG: hypothetical protein ACREJ0_06455, partial [Geminicoccaceae bacterium]